MGTKREIAPHVAAIISEGRSGPLLDLFSGICAIGSAVTPDRQVWCNDAQVFASTVAAAFFTSREGPIDFHQAADLATPTYLSNKRKLDERFQALLHLESGAIESRGFEQLAELERQITSVSKTDALEGERKRLARKPSTTPYRLFSVTFAGGYLGLAQSIQVDSIRFALDALRTKGTLDDEQHRWMLLALAQAVSKVSTTTGHFAQYMKVKPSTVRRFVAQRTRSVWFEWLKAIFEFAPLGTRSWRARNQVFQSDAAHLLSQLRESKRKPTTIYADPPYTSDQYSRYYHLYETLILYDYPPAVGVGRYRPDRFVSSYSLKTAVEESIGRLISDSAALGSRLVLSYPEHGLLPDAEKTITSLIRQCYRRGGVAARLPHRHSSLGGSKGKQKYAVNELIFAAG